MSNREPDGGATRRTRIEATLVDQAIALTPLWDVLADDDAGAHLVFVGRTRRRTGSQVTERLAYEAFRPMALEQLHALLNEAADRWVLTTALVVHRLGCVPVGEASVAVAVSSPHRGDGLQAVTWIMDQLKQRVPIWKREYFADGTTQWIHPHP